MAISETQISDLQIFARVAAAGSMSAAGRDMGLSPAVVSKRIACLERQLGARLFQRTTRQLALTETGEGLFERVRGILERLDEAESFVSGRHGRAKGTLKVSAPPTFGERHFAPLISDFLARYPELRIELILQDGAVDLIGQGLDLAIRMEELENSSLMVRKLVTSRAVLVASPEFLASRGQPSTIDALAKLPCLTKASDATWRLALGPDSHRVVVEGPIRTNSEDVLRTAALDGLGVALLPDWLVSDDLAIGRLKRVLAPAIGADERSVQAVFPHKSFKPEKLKVLLEFLAERYATRFLAGHPSGPSDAKDRTPRRPARRA